MLAVYGLLLLRCLLDANSCQVGAFERTLKSLCDLNAVVWIASVTFAVLAIEFFWIATGIAVDLEREFAWRFTNYIRAVTAGIFGALMASIGRNPHAVDAAGPGA
ncbi:MAG: hypothetical protein ACM3ZT_09750 [Bacillota bacterium]